MTAKTSAFVPLDNDQTRQRVIALGLKKIAPETGPEKHFLMALADPRRVSCRLEQEWIDYFNECADAESASHSPEDNGVIYPKQGLIAANRPSPMGTASLIDLAVVASNLGNNVYSTEQIIQDPLIKEAIEMTTNRPLEELASSPEMLRGVVSTAKGKYFELLVRDQINSGTSFGDISLAHGQIAELAEKLNQPGWDIAITDSQGHIADVVQLKATESVRYIKNALERYPDIKIISTSEVAHAADSHQLVIDSGISDQAIENTVGHAISYASADFVDVVVDSFNPLFPLVFIAATEGYKVAVGARSVEEALANAADRSKRSLTGGAVGAVFYAMGFGWTSIIPAVLAARAGPDGMSEYIEDCCEKLGGAINTFEKRVGETKRKANDDMPRLCIECAKQLTDRAIKEGIDAIFSPQYIKRGIGSLGGFEFVNTFRIAYHMESLYNEHPAVRAATLERSTIGIRKRLHKEN